MRLAFFDNSRLLVALADAWDSTRGWLYLLNKPQELRLLSNPESRSEVKAYPISFGKNGLAWGSDKYIQLAEEDGLDPKREGDGRTPVGVYQVKVIFGKEPRTQLSDDWTYIQTHQDLLCIDDPNSKNYNQMVDIRTIPNHDWESAELLYREDFLYDLCVEIGYNPPPALAMAGSCIFIHTWRDVNAPTEGCIGLDHGDLYELVEWLYKGPTVQFCALPEALLPTFIEASKAPYLSV